MLHWEGVPTIFDKDCSYCTLIKVAFLLIKEKNQNFLTTCELTNFVFTVYQEKNIFL